jgi:F-type H+-transporting ATPase subunit epsilon
MEKTFRFELVTPSELVVSLDATSVVVPGSEGYLGVLPEHTYFITALKEGTLVVHETDKTTKYDIGKGYVQITPDKTIIVTESAKKQES